MRSQETLKAIVEGAAQVLMREGYARATTNRIAERSGLSVGTLYQYFSNKDEIFEFVLRAQADSLRAVIRDYELDPERPFEETLHEVIGLLVLIQRHGPDLYRQLEAIPGGRFRQAVEDLNEELEAFLLGILEAYREEIGVPDLERAAFVLIHSAVGVGLAMRSAEFDSRFVDELRDLFLAYLTSRPKRTSA